MTSEFETKLKELRELQEKEELAVSKEAERKWLIQKKISEEKATVRKKERSTRLIKLQKTAKEFKGILQKVNEHHLQSGGEISKDDFNEYSSRIRVKLVWGKDRDKCTGRPCENIIELIRGTYLQEEERFEINKIVLKVGGKPFLENFGVEDLFGKKKFRIEYLRLCKREHVFGQNPLMTIMIRIYLVPLKKNFIYSSS